jgi:hypothetical protein
MVGLEGIGYLLWHGGWSEGESMVGGGVDAISFCGWVSNATSLELKGSGNVG